jgi:hypothetical protein
VASADRRSKQRDDYADRSRQVLADEKGVGFTTPENGRADVVVHVSALKGVARLGRATRSAVIWARIARRRNQRPRMLAQSDHFTALMTKKPAAEEVH